MKTQHTRGAYELLRQGIEAQPDPKGPHFAHEIVTVIDGLPVTLAFIPIQSVNTEGGSDKRVEIGKDESLANAQIFAAAPELLGALEELVEAIQYTPLGVHALTIIKKAKPIIAKAKGE